MAPSRVQVAARAGCDAGVRYLLSRHVNINACVNVEGEGPLHAAAMGGHRSTFRLLLLFGADDTLVDMRGRTCYHYWR